MPSTAAGEFSGTPTPGEGVAGRTRTSACLDWEKWAASRRCETPLHAAASCRPGCGCARQSGRARLAPAWPENICVDSLLVSVAQLVGMPSCIVRRWAVAGASAVRATSCRKGIFGISSCACCCPARWCCRQVAPKHAGRLARRACHVDTDRRCQRAGRHGTWTPSTF
jgi:hypothetical protein